MASANLFLRNPRPRAVGQVAAGLDADVLLLLEWSGDNLDRDAARAGGWRLVLDEARPDGLGLAVLIRGDLPVRAALLPSPLPGPCQAPVAAVRVEGDGRPLALLGVHAPPPGAPCGHRNVPTLSALARWVVDGRLGTDHGPCRAGDPVVLLGDLNALPRSIALAPLADAGLHDAWPVVRDRAGPTWAPLLTALPVLRIDAVYVPESLAVTGSWTVALPGSDHCAVVAELRR